MGTNTHKYTTVSLPIPLNDKLKKLIEPTGFASVSSFVTYVLRQIVSDSQQIDAKPLDYSFNKQDEDKVKDRLRSLGYLK
ncbi:MAG: CopG family transcriptional regulator [Patescibacteria group bacterium]